MPTTKSANDHGSRYQTCGRTLRMTGKETEFDNTKGPAKVSRMANSKPLAIPELISQSAYSARAT